MDTTTPDDVVAGKSRIDISLAAESYCFSFYIQGQGFVLDYKHPVEVIVNPDYSPLPNTPAYCLGLTNVRGNVVPIYCIQSLINEAASQPDYEYGLMIGKGNDAVILTIDNKPKSFLVSEMTFIDAPIASESELSRFVKAQYRHKDDVWNMIDCPSLFTFLVASDGF